MNSIEFYFDIPEEYKGKVIELPDHPELEKYQNYDAKIKIPTDARYLMLMQIGLCDPTISFYDKDGCPLGGGYENYIFINSLEKRIGMIFGKVERIPC